MLDLSQIVGFDWDDGNNLKSAKHSVSQIEAEQVFADRRLLVADDVKHSQDEVRYHALGHTFENRLLFVAFTFRTNGTKIRVISARDVNRKERGLYDRET
jgi:uncharacterized protein